MAEITAQLVKDLREKTGAGMMDCKKALTESNGDLEAAIDWLRKKGLSAAAKKAGRVAAEGLVAVAAAANAAAVVEINAETDFVGRNQQFQDMVAQCAQIALSGHDTPESLLAANFPNAGRNVQDQITHLIATIGENMSLRRVKRLQVSSGVVASYVHGALVPNVGKIGVLVALESSAAADKLMELGKQIAMHIAAASPLFLDIAAVDNAALDRERAIFTEQATAAGKPAEIVAKMVEGRVRKYYEEVVLTEQVFVVDGETKIAKVIENAAKTLGAPVKLTGFVRFQLGEGIEKESSDFAAEVAKMAS
jgi:elongation factor Ts